MFKLRVLIFIILLSSLTISALGLEPFECVLIANRKSQNSLALANFYADLRGIPDENLVHIEIDEALFAAPYTVGFNDFIDLVYHPVKNAIEERGLASIISAWIYSTDMPIRVEMAEDVIMSIQGATLTAESPPSNDQVEQARYQSPFYAGPSPNQDSLRSTRSFDRFLDDVEDRHGYPSMMLSFTQPGGLNMLQSKEVLRRGKIADGSSPAGKVFFIITEDAPRSKPREWQFEPAAGLLVRSGVNAVVKDSIPSEQSEIIGLQIGIRRTDTASIGTFLPGAMAENMTSWGASFDRSGHTKATEWLAAGATASSGTVTEPFSLWPKFPTAFFFHHYRSGATIIESFFQSILSPVQILLLGDPLARPWAIAPNVTVINLEQSERISGDERFFARIFQTIDPNLEPRFEFHLDGRPIAKDLASGQIGMDTNRIPDGHHTLRAVIGTKSQVNIKPSGRLDFVSDNRGRIPILNGLDSDEEHEIGSEIRVSVTAPREAISVGLRSRRLVLEESESHESDFNIDAEMLGSGRVPIQAFARYDDGETSFSAPVRIQIVDK